MNQTTVSVANETTTRTASIMEELLKSGAGKPVPKVGEIIEGTILSVSKHAVYLDIDGLRIGVVRGRELFDESGEYSNISIGNTAAATVIDIENENGDCELSFRHAGHQRAWEHLEKLQRDGTITQVKIVSANRGGLMVNLGNMNGFLPVSQLTVEHYPRVEGGDKQKILERLNKFVNQTFDVKVIDTSEREKKLIVSERAAWEERQRATISGYQVGNVIEGKITGVVDFGAFMEFGEGLEGLIHISELAWQRVDDPQNIVNVGDAVKAQIIDVSGTKISLSLKRLMEDPWSTVHERYTVGQSVTGKVRKVNPFGLFIELDHDIHGLAHLSELLLPAGQTIETFAKPGDELPFFILSIDPKEHRLGLSMKEPTGEQKEEPKEEPASVPQEPAPEAESPAPESIPSES